MVALTVVFFAFVVFFIVFVVIFFVVLLVVIIFVFIAISVSFIVVIECVYRPWLETPTGQLFHDIDKLLSVVFDEIVGDCEYATLKE